MSVTANEPEHAHPPIVSLKNVCLRADRGGYVFRDLNLVLKRGRSIVVVGGAGSGKTTLADLLLGIRFAESGEVRLFGKEIKKRSRRTIRKIRTRIGGVGGRFDLVPSLTVADNIRLPLVIGSARKRMVKERLRKVLSEFHLLKLAGKYPHELTRVEHTLAQFARACVHNQPLMLIDEPMAGLDTNTYMRVAESLVREALAGRSMVILMSQEPATTIPNTEVVQLSGGVLE